MEEGRPYVRKSIIGISYVYNSTLIFAPRRHPNIPLIFGGTEVLWKLTTVLQTKEGALHFPTSAGRGRMQITGGVGVSGEASQTEQLAE